MDPTGRFVALMRGTASDLRLDEAALLISAHANVDLDVAAQLDRLDALAASCTACSVDGLRELLFDRLGLRGNRDDYGDPANSFLDQVLDRGLGIPISLSVLMMVLGDRLGLSLEGVGMPGHFLVRDRLDPRRLIDPYHQGRRLDPAECERIFRDLYGPGVSFSERLLAPTEPRLILARMLANLASSYTLRGDTKALTWVIRLRAAIPDLAKSERAQLAGQMTQMGRFDDAAAVWEDLAGEADVGAGESSELRTRALRLRARLN